MQLEDLKPTWKHFQVLNSLDAINSEEIRALIGEVEQQPGNRIYRFAINCILFLTLIACCQGG